jgi:hypothetical protein
MLLGIVGHTPSFNDGDICTHSDSSFAVSKSDAYDDDYSLEEIFEKLSDETHEMTDLAKDEFFRTTDLSDYFSIGDDEKAEIPFPAGVDLKAIASKGTTPATGKVAKILKLLNSQHCANDLYETNYLVTAKIVNGVVEISQDDYWPSY